MCQIEPPELAWPLRFYFVWATADDGGAHKAVCVGFEIGEAIPNPDRADVLTLPDDAPLTGKTVLAISDKFAYYRQMAEDMLIPTVQSEESARQTRAAMGKRRRGGKLEDAELAVLVNEWRDRVGQPDRTIEMASAHGINRVTLRRRLEEAERRGLIPEGLERRPSRVGN